jgi:hypothetical protein
MIGYSYSRTVDSAGAYAGRDGRALKAAGRVAAHETLVSLDGCLILTGKVGRGDAIQTAPDSYREGERAGHHILHIFLRWP